MPPEGRDVGTSLVFRVAPDGSRVIANAECEYPSGRPSPPNEHTLYVANTRTRMFIHAFDVP
jgi:hypothetical protein